MYDSPGISPGITATEPLPDWVAPAGEELIVHGPEGSPDK